MTSDVSMQNMLAATTDAILAGQHQRKVRRLMRSYDVPRAEAESLLDVVYLLEDTLVEVQPSPRFARRLKRDLQGEQVFGVWRPWRRLPARVQVAALAAVLGGFWILIRRRFGDAPDTTDTEEAPVLH